MPIDNPTRFKSTLLAINQPNYAVPLVRENKDKGGYLTYGDDNLYPEYLWNCFTNSSVNNSLIIGKTNFICGEALISKSDNKEIESFIESCNPQGDSLEEIFRKCAQDVEIFGGFALQIVYTKLGGEIAGIYYVSIPKFRFDLTQSKLKYSRDWNPRTNSKIKVIEYDLYTEADKTGTKIFYYRGTLTRDTYPVPGYVGSLQAIETNIEIQNFNRANIKNGMFPSLMINFRNGQPETEDEEIEIEEKINSKFGGSSNTGRALITFSDSDNDSPVITPIQQPDLDKMFTVLADSVRDSIFVGHRISAPNIFGVTSAAKLGNTNEFNQGVQTFMKTYVKPARKILLKIFNKILSTNFPNCDIDVKDSDPLDTVFTNEQIITNSMTQEEVRIKLKKEGFITDISIPDGVKTIGEAASEKIITKVSPDNVMPTVEDDIINNPDTIIK